MDIRTAITAHRAARSETHENGRREHPGRPEDDAAHDAEQEATHAAAEEASMTKRPAHREVGPTSTECDEHDRGEPPWAGLNYGMPALAVQGVPGVAERYCAFSARHPAREGLIGRDMQRRGSFRADPFLFGLLLL